MRAGHVFSWIEWRTQSESAEAVFTGDHPTGKRSLCIPGYLLYTSKESRGNKNGKV